MWDGNDDYDDDNINNDEDNDNICGDVCW